ncbi:glycosyltransferase [Paenibacillus sp. MBLB4367]|uniref:glycosyltransferase n=1 Tax=Paenibacillus sp. MBLB4367 TaxID=3384767 RepID=UPI003907FFF3
MKTSIVILAQQIECFKQCLAHIRLHTEGLYDVIVVNDGNCKDIGIWAGKDPSIRVVSVQERCGVAAGYNRGAAAATGSRLVFMRDHAAVTERWLQKLTDCMDHHRDAAIVGPVINDVSGPQRLELPPDPGGRPDIAGRIVSRIRSGQSRPVPRVLSHLMMIRRETFVQLGGFDERFRLEGYEDDDLCYRALQMGFGLYVSEDCYVRYLPLPPLFPEDAGWYGRQLMENKAIANEKWGFDLTQALFAWKRKVSVSLCMIVKNEEQTLRRCLDSIHALVDEIVIVDTGSEDGTKDIARAYTTRIYDFEWVDDFAKARNFAFGMATKEFILWLDADDRLLSEDGDKLRKLLGGLDWDADAVSMPYLLGFDEQGNVTASLRRNRLVRRSCNFRWEGAVHEYLQVTGKLVVSDAAVTHDRKHTNRSRNLAIYEDKLAAGEVFTTRELYYYANELADHEAWERAIEAYGKFLSAADGWVEDKIAACGRMSDCYCALGRLEEAKGKALQSFVYDLPRAESCCKLGYYHFLEQDYVRAIYWYKLASKIKRPEHVVGLLHHASWTWLPHLQLSVCYDRIGQPELASYHNEAASSYLPNHESVLANRRYFESLLGAPEKHRSEGLAV